MGRLEKDKFKGKIAPEDARIIEANFISKFAMYMYLWTYLWNSGINTRKDMRVCMKINFIDKILFETSYYNNTFLAEQVSYLHLAYVSLQRKQRRISM